MMPSGLYIATPDAVAPATGGHASGDYVYKGPNLQPVAETRSGPLRFQCTRCHGWAHQFTGTVYADLNGPAFQAYYCAPCAQGYL